MMAWTTALLLFLGIAVHGVAGDSYQSKLANYIKSHSDPDVPPQQDFNTPVPVYFNMSILNIADVDKEHRTLTAEIYIRPRWNSSITWDPADFGGADWITLPKKYFWIPTLQEIDTAVEMKDLSLQKCVLMNDGTIIINMLHRINILCDVRNIDSTGATCSSKSTVFGYSKDQVFVTGIGGDSTNSMNYFAGTKYEITRFERKENILKFKHKYFQIFTTEMDIIEKMPNCGAR